MFQEYYAYPHATTSKLLIERRCLWSRLAIHSHFYAASVGEPRAQPRRLSPGGGEKCLLHLASHALAPPPLPPPSSRCSTALPSLCLTALPTQPYLAALPTHPCLAILLLSTPALLHLPCQPLPCFPPQPTFPSHSLSHIFPQPTPATSSFHPTRLRYSSTLTVSSLTLHSQALPHSPPQPPFIPQPVVVKRTPTANPL